MAAYSFYVDVDADAGGNGTTAALTGANCAFKSLSLAEAYFTPSTTPTYDLSNGDTITLNCGSNHASNHTADTAAVVFNGWTFGNGGKITIKSDSASRAGMVYSATKYRLEGVDFSQLNLYACADAIIEADGLQIRRTNLTQSVANIGFVGIGDGQTTIVKNCHIRNDYTGSTYYIPLVCTAQLLSAAGTFSLINCVLVNRGTSTNSSNVCIKVNAAQLTTNLYSCMASGGRYAIWRNAGTTNAKNCIATLGGNTDWTGTITRTNCASEDTSATGTNCVTGVAHSTANYESVTDGSEDFSLKSGAALRNVGVDTSGESAPLNFTTDIRAYTRSGTWDIGPWDYDAAGAASASFVSQVMRHFSNLFGGGL